MRYATQQSINSSQEESMEKEKKLVRELIKLSKREIALTKMSRRDAGLSEIETRELYETGKHKEDILKELEKVRKGEH